MAAAETGVLQLSTPGVLASVLGCSSLARSSARGAAATPLGSRAPLTGGEGERLSTCAWGILTGANGRP
eukprot:2289073-Pleurochrysis_carterae.AAC.1